MVTRTMVIQGMNNQDDVQKVNSALHEIWGIRKVEISLDRKEATFTFDESAASFEDFQEAVLELGFEIETENGLTRETMHDWHLEDTAGGNRNAPDL